MALSAPAAGRASCHISHTKSIAGRRGTLDEMMREIGGWELVVVRWGVLAGSMTTAPGADPRPAVELLRASARVVERPDRVGEVASIEETSLLADWVLDDGARIVEVDGDPAVLTWPIGSAARHRKVLASED